MSITAIIAVKVEEYQRFKGAFDQRAAARVAAGIESKAYRVMDDANRVVVIGTGSSKESIMEFMTSPEQKQAMQNAGIQGPPEFTFLEG